MKITDDIKNKIISEANWRSTNGHGGVDETTRDNFILAASWGYELAYNEILESKGLVKKEQPDQRCICGHLHSEHRPINSVNYSAGRCTVGECRCAHFLIDNGNQKNPMTIHPTPSNQIKFVISVLEAEIKKLKKLIELQNKLDKRYKL